MRTNSIARVLRALTYLGTVLSCSITFAAAQESLVTVQVFTASGQKTVASGKDSSANAPSLNTVVWLSPVDRSVAADAQPPQKRPKLTQRNKTFEPHMLVVQAGTTIDFPNKDPFFHNVFSLFDGKRFDLGLYEAGTTNSAKFERVGVSFIFCNIHPEMNAVVVAVDTPYYSVTDSSGRASLANVPDGKYQMHVWSERGLPEDLKKQARNVTISSENRALPAIYLTQNPNITAAHKNKYGQAYVPPPETSYPH
jgi:plastocyanin